MTQKTNSLNERIFQTFEMLREKPSMIISNHNSYELLQNYIEGYIDGLSLFLNKNMRLEITKWYQKKINMESNFYWTGHIPFHFTGKNEDELKIILLDITEEFFRTNLDWYEVNN